MPFTARARAAVRLMRRMRTAVRVHRARPRTAGRAGLVLVIPALVILALASALAAHARPAPDDPVEGLRALLRRLRERPEMLAGPALERARANLVDVRLLWSFEPARGADVARVLLDVMGQYLDAASEPGTTTPSPEAELRDTARSVLESRLDAPLGRWLATSVLPAASGEPIERRRAVARLFETNTVPSAREPLLVCARETDRDMALAARRALAGWSDDAVHELFFAELGGSGPRRDLALESLAERHFDTTRFGETTPVAGPLAARVRRELVDPDWRTASRAVRLSRPLENEAVVPALIEALSAWTARGKAGLASLRLRHELSRALRERSGRALGLEAGEWRSWWSLVRAGGVRGLSPRGAGGLPESTQASFFGVRPQSDRIVFVIDRSGSMNEPYHAGAGQAARTRFDEAARQLATFLESMGPATKFDVVLFHDLAEAWKGELVPATPENLAAVREWLSWQKPAGGTRLRAGIETALHVGPDRQLVASRIEADTVIVLCDGETTEGSAWVDPFLDLALPATRTIVHGVQLGPDGDGTMPELARRSRGDYVRLDG